MSHVNSDSHEGRAEFDRSLPILVILFVGSGCAALIYEIVWLQLLQLVIGSSAVSLGVLLGTFMGGMCLGSLLLPRVVSANWHPLKVYGAIEIVIGAIGIVLIFTLPLVNVLYSLSAAHGWMGLVLRATIAGVCLLPPTVLMGATLPAVARWVKATPHGISSLGFFYGSNIAGAVLGCILAGFYLLRVHDMATASYVAATINFGVGLLALVAAARHPHSATVTELAATAAQGGQHPWSVYLTIGLSGLCAMGAEVVWTRLLSLLIGGTVYTFSIILAVFLLGLGIGSSVGSLLAKGPRPRLALGICQLLLVGAISWAALQLGRSLPYWPIQPSLAISPWHSFQLDLLRCAWVVLPAACLWGASFPLALSAACSSGSDTSRLVGAVYAANTVGAILGALGFSIFIVGWIGTQHAQQSLMVLSISAGSIVLIPLLWSDEGPAGHASAGAAVARTATLAVGIVLAALLTWHVPPTPAELIAYGRYVPRDRGSGLIVYSGEGMNSSVAVSLLDGGVRNFHVSGKIEASSEPQDMRLQRMLGHIPALIHSSPKKVLVVGCGAGVTAGSFLVHPSVERIVICEIEPLIPQVVAEHFAQENYGVVRDAKVEVVYDDARHFILTTREKFDVITSDPIHPWVKGAATLYTREYFELCKARLNEGGVITQWVPLYESNAAAVKSEVATFFEVFPEGTVWSNDVEGQGYDIVLLGQVGPLSIDVDRLQQRLGREDHFRVDESLYEVGFGSGLELLATYAGTAADLKPWLDKAEINRDRNLRLQYLAGMSPHSYREVTIFNEMLKYRRFPDKLFVASADTMRDMRRRLGFVEADH